MTLLTPEEAAKELSISDRQLRILTKAGQIKYVNIGHGSKRETPRYTQADLTEFIERRKKTWVSTNDPARKTTGTISILRESAFRRAAPAKPQSGKPKNS